MPTAESHIRPDAKHVQYRPPALFRLQGVTVTEGWDIEYVVLGNIILTAFRKSPFPLCTPANAIDVHIVPWVYGGPMGEMIHTVKPAVVTITGELFDTDF